MYEEQIDSPSTWGLFFSLFLEGPDLKKEKVCQGAWHLQCLIRKARNLNMFQQYTVFVHFVY